MPRLRLPLASTLAAVASVAAAGGLHAQASPIDGDRYGPPPAAAQPPGPAPAWRGEVPPAAFDPLAPRPPRPSPWRGDEDAQPRPVRIYSVARPFDLQPDPPPIPPQFFAATADLGAVPDGPPPIGHATPAARAAEIGGPDGGGP